MNIIYRKTFRLFLLFLVIIYQPSHSQSITNKGKDFWFAFPKSAYYTSDTNAPAYSTLQVYINSNCNTTGNINILEYGFSQSFNVSPDSATTINIPASYYVTVTNSETIEEKGIHITSDDDISVYFAWNQNYQREGAMVLPSNVIGNEYFVMCRYSHSSNSTNMINNQQTEFLIVSTEDNTDVTIDLSDTTDKGLTAGSQINIMLNAGYTYQVRSPIKGTFDLSGSRITSTKPIVVFSGDAYAEIDSCTLASSVSGNPLLEQLYPVETWGKKYALIPGKYHIEGDIFRVLASTDNTNIYLDGMLVQTLMSGGYYDIDLLTPGFLCADKNILIGQFFKNGHCNGTPPIPTQNYFRYGDPALVLLNPFEQSVKETSFTNPRAFIDKLPKGVTNIVDSHFVIAAAPTVDLPLIQLDGIAVGSKFVPMSGNGNYSYAIISVSPGKHTLIDDGLGLVAMAYGEGGADAYSFSAGAGFEITNNARFSVQTKSDSTLVNKFSCSNLQTLQSCIQDTIQCNFTGLDSVLNIFWDFGDGTTSTDINPTHIYTNTGTYTISLTVITIETEKYSCTNLIDTGIATKVIEIGSIDAGFVITHDPCKLNEVFFLDTSGISNDNIVYWEWTFGDGDTDNVQYAVHTFDTTGSFNINLTIQSDRGCIDTATEVVDKIARALDLGPDTSTCQNFITLDASIPNGSNYLWSTQDTTPTIQVGISGTYKVQADNGPCTEYDSINVEIIEDCDDILFIPNSFTPNDDGINDIFIPTADLILSINIKIYDQWNNLVFETKEVNTGWDGTYKGELLEPGIFIYLIQDEIYDKKTGESISSERIGNVSLIR